MSAAFPKEILTSERGTDGEWHARYPSGTHTLCGRESVGTKKGRKYPPTCGVCGKAARAIDAIDRSMPEHWRLPESESPARRDFLAHRVHQLEAENARLLTRIRELERSRDLWRQRATGTRSRAA